MKVAYGGERGISWDVEDGDWAHVARGVVPAWDIVAVGDGGDFVRGDYRNAPTEDYCHEVQLEVVYEGSSLAQFQEVGGECGGWDPL